MLSLIGGLMGGLGGLFGDESSSTSVTDATSQDLPDAQLQELLNLFSEMINNGSFQFANESMQGQLGRVNNEANRVPFQVEQFAKDITAQAAASAGLNLESNKNQILQANGGSEGGNSMSSLLINKERNITADNLAGIAANARAKGEEIRMAQFKNNTENVLGLSGGLSSQLLNLIMATRGANKKAHSKTTQTSESGGGIGGFFKGFADGFGSMSA